MDGLGNLPRVRVAMAGHTRDAATAREGLADHAPEVRAAALGALARLRILTDADIRAGTVDGAASVRRSACEVAASTGQGVSHVAALLADDDPTVVEVAAWALGEFGPNAASMVPDLSRIAVEHDDPLAREAAIAALGAIGDRRGLAAILTGTRDKPAVRRRAVLALAPFDGPEVDEALHRAIEDRDWQVRDAAELLLRPD